MTNHDRQQFERVIQDGGSQPRIFSLYGREVVAKEDERPTYAHTYLLESIINSSNKSRSFEITAPRGVAPQVYARALGRLANESYLIELGYVNAERAVKTDHYRKNAELAITNYAHDHPLGLLVIERSLSVPESRTATFAALIDKAAELSVPTLVLLPSSPQQPLRPPISDKPGMFLAPPVLSARGIAN